MSFSEEIYKVDYSLEKFFGINHHTALITGAAGQIGGELTKMILSLGGKVIAVDLNMDQLEERLEDHGNLIKIACDVRKEDEVEAVFKNAINQGYSPTALINNAGMSVFEDFSQRDEESFDMVMDVNLKGCFWFIKHFINHAKKDESKHYRIVNIASHYGIIAPDFRIYEEGDRKNSEIYGATKAGVVQMTKYFAANIADRNIRVNAVAPGGVRNPWTPQSKNFQEKYAYRCPLKRMAEIEEIVGGICFLLSNASSYINGHTLVIDGGMTAW